MQLVFEVLCMYIFVKMKWTDEFEAALLQLWWKSEQETEKNMVSKTPVESNFKTGTLSEAGKGETQGP